MHVQVRAAGMIINSMGWIDGLGYELILHSLQTFRVDIILVIGQDRLFSQLSTRFSVRLVMFQDQASEECRLTVVLAASHFATWKCHCRAIKQFL